MERPISAGEVSVSLEVGLLCVSAPHKTLYCWSGTDSMRRELMVILLVLLAGCSGLNGGAPSTQPTETTSAIPTTTSSPSNATPTAATPSNTVNYTALSETEQQAFDAAQQRATGFAPDAVRESPYVNRTYFPTDAKEVFQEHEYLQKNGSYHQLSWDVGPTLATYEIQVTDHQPSENASVVVLENLSSEVREPVQKAIENGSYDTPFGKWDSLPENLSTADFVRANGTHYKLDVIAGDFWADEMRAEPVE